MKLFYIWSVLLLFSTAGLANTYEVDSAESTLKWVGKKVGSQHNGTIKIKSGKFELNQAKSQGTFIFDMTSIINEDVENPKYNKKLVDHLKSDDFFSVATFPTAQFSLKSVKKVGSKDYEFNGDLTIKNKTHPLTFKGTLAESAKGVRVKAKATFDRTKYDIKYNSKKFFDLKALGDKLILDEVDVEIEVVGQRVKAS